MFCRRAWQRVGPLAWSAFKPASRNAPVRHMAFGVPGGSTNMAYFVLCGGGLTAAVVYAYKTVNGDGERYEDRLANMGSTAKAPAAETAPEVAAPAAEPAPVEEAAPAAEVVVESVSAPAEPVAETAAEPVVEAVSEEVAAVSEEPAAVAPEVVVTEAAAEPAAAEEAVPPVAVEAVPEAAPVAAIEEAPVEAPAAESAESMPDLLTAVKTLASSTVEIAAASVGETSLVKAVRQIEEDGKSLDSTLEVLKPEATTDVIAKEGCEEAVVVNEEELKSAEVPTAEEVADTEDAGAPAVEVVIKEETSAPAASEDEEEAAAPLPEEPATSAPTVEEVGEVQAEDQAPVPEAAPEEAVSSTEASPEDAAPTEETTPAEEATTTAEHTPVEEETPAVETSVEEAAAEAPAEETLEAVSTHTEAAAVVDMTQLAAASAGSDLEVLSAAEPESTSEAPVEEAKHCHSCHSAPSAGEEAPPAAAGGQLEVQLVSEGAVDVTHEAKEEMSLVEGQTTETMVVVTAQS